VPWIIDYPLVLDQMREQGFKCLYFNSGAFGFADVVREHVAGWIGGDDPSIRDEARAAAVVIAPPIEENLAALFVRAWNELSPGSIWLMPKTHWSHELEHGSRAWMPAVLERVGVDPGQLAHRTNAAAIEFTQDESAAVNLLVERFLSALAGSDFMIAFPRRPLLCTLHHHKQLWWQTAEEPLAQRLRQTALEVTRAE